MRDNLGPAPKVALRLHPLPGRGAVLRRARPDQGRRLGGQFRGQGLDAPRAAAILGTSRPVPIKHILAGSSLSAEQAQQVRDYFLSLDTSDEGKKRLEPIKYQGFAPYDEAEMLAIGKWLGL